MGGIISSLHLKCIAKTVMRKVLQEGLPGHASFVQDQQSPPIWCSGWPIAEFV